MCCHVVLADDVSWMYWFIQARFPSMIHHMVWPARQKAPVGACDDCIDPSRRLCAGLPHALFMAACSIDLSAVH